MANKHKDRHKLPLWHRMIEHQQRKDISFHTPGHKGRFFIQDTFSDTMGQAWSFDLTELPGLDNLAHPTGVIQQAQELAATVFGAEQSFFLVNGSTVGIQAMIMSTCPPGSKLLVPRNVHRSVISGMVLADVMPVYMETKLDPRYGVALPYDLQQVHAHLSADDAIRGVLVINPTYHGLCGGLQELVKIVHGFGVPLLVDEAHGTHLPFHDQLPASAMATGADMCVQSLHKTGLSLTQSSLLHWQPGLVNIDKVVANLQLLQSSSPSYLLMASLDWARQQLQVEANSRLTQLLANLDWFKAELSNKTQVQSLNSYWLQFPEVKAVDPAKLNLCARPDLSGQQLADFLADHRIQVEMVEPDFVLGITSIHTTQQDLQTLLEVLQKIEHTNATNDLTPNSIHAVYVPDQAMTPREAWFAPKVRVPLQHSIGRIVAELVAPCPPGIPLICPGERVDQMVVEACLRWGVESLLVVE